MVAYALVEDALCGRDASRPCADFLVLGRWAAGVVDGSSPKPGVPSVGVGGEVVARTVAAELESLPEDVTVEEVVTLVSQAVARLGDNGDLDFGARACATFAVLHAPSRQIWRVGDPTVLVSGKVVPQRPRKGELIVARARALVLRERLLAGVSVDQLRVLSCWLAWTGSATTREQGTSGTGPLTAAQSRRSLLRGLTCRHRNATS